MVTELIEHPAKYQPTDGDCLDHPDAGMAPIPTDPSWRRCTEDGCMFTRGR